MKPAILAALVCLALAGCGSKDAAPAGGTKDAAGPLEIGNVAELPGTGYLVADVIGPGDGGAYLSSSGSGPQVHNLLLVERDGGKTHALLPDNKGLIERSWFVPARAQVLTTPFDDYTQRGDGPPAPPAWFVLETRPSPGSETVSVRVGAMADLKSTVVLDGFAKVLARWMIDDHRLAVMAVRKGETRTYEIDMKARVLSGSHEVPVGE